MTYRSILAVSISLLVTTASFAQAPTKKRTSDRADFSTFKKQMMELPEYRDERKKIPKLQKEHRGQEVKIIAVVDKVPVDPDEDVSGSIINGGIRQVIGADTSAVYDIEFDRVTKKITSVKPTGEGSDPEEVEKRHGRDKDDDADDKEPREKKSKEKDDE